MSAARKGLRMMSADQLTPAERGPEARARLLEALYDEAGGSLTATLNIRDVARSIGMDQATASDASLHLQRTGRLENMSMGGTGSLSVRAIEEVERRRAARRQRSRSEAPATEAVLIITHAERAAVEAAVSELDRAEVADSLVGEDFAEYDAERATVAAQLRSSRPKRPILRTALGRLVDFATQIGDGYVAARLSGLL
jgi:hypothetical protein